MIPNTLKLDKTFFAIAGVMGIAQANQDSHNSVDAYGT